MKFLKIFTSVILLILLSWQGKAQDVEPHLAQIILWRTGEFNHPNLRNRVELNGVQVANLSSKNYIKMIVPAGKYVLKVGDVEFRSSDGNLNSKQGKWIHLPEGGEYELEVSEGMVYNIEGIMLRTDPEADSAQVEKKLRYYMKLKRYRGSFGHLQRELDARKMNLNTGYAYSRVQIVTSYGKKIKACLVNNTDDYIEFIELESLVPQVQRLEKSNVVSISLL